MFGNLNGFYHAADLFIDCPSPDRLSCRVRRGPKLEKARRLMSEFQCPGGGVKDHNGNWARIMASDEEKAREAISRYERGVPIGHVIDVLVQHHVSQYRIACEGSKEAALGI